MPTDDDFDEYGTTISRMDLVRLINEDLARKGESLVPDDCKIKVVMGYFDQNLHVLWRRLKEKV